VSDWATRDLDRPSAFIQWKGTDVCMDCFCSCGKRFHIDHDFAYAVQCRHCGKRFEMSAMIEMREIPSDEDWKGCPVLIEVVQHEDERSCSSHTEPVEGE
jgi:hypothetical protein